ncbi:MAG: hypothetical protein HC802_01130, partial [Caldilineaceae bacterium]|nr:hypothetical protein [Caldilineaceae bacterium]
MKKIDAHIHFGDDDAALLALLDDLDIQLFNICVADEAGSAWRSSAEIYCDLTEARPQRFAWCTSFDLPQFDNPNYVDEVISGLDRDFAAGAVACKVWKNVGMEVK